MSAYELIHLGGEDGVTGSCHLLLVKGLKILVDCGLAQGDDRVMPMSEWPVKVVGIDYLFLTHAKKRFLMGKEFHGSRSPFLNKIENELVESSKSAYKIKESKETQQMELF